MPGRWFGSSAVVALAALLALAPRGAGADSPLVLRAAVDGEINSVTAAYIAQAVDRADSEHASMLLVVMNTPGGISGPMDDIVTELLKSKTPVVVFVAPAGARADSAGLFVAEAADLVAMAPGTNVGSAHPIDASGADLSGDLGKKVLNDAVARIRNEATEHGRNADWCERAVRESVNINAEQAVDLHVADLEARNESALLAQLDGRGLTRPNGQILTLHLAHADVEDASMSWLQQLLHALIDPNVAFLLLLVAVYGLIAEVTTPGAVLPGTVGVISAILALVALASLPVNIAGVLLILFAVLLFIADIKAPTHGILSVGGVIALLLGSAFLIDTGPVGTGVSPWISGAGTLVTLGFFFLVLRRVLAARRRPAFVGGEMLIGKVGEAREDLAPTGLVYVSGALWRAVAGSGTIKSGTPVRVTGRTGLELAVEKAEEG